MTPNTEPMEAQTRRAIEQEYYTFAAEADRRVAELRQQYVVHDFAKRETLSGGFEIKVYGPY
jgi:hypothetical protein